MFMGPTDPPIPTDFEWWANIWVPAGLGVLTLLFTATSVVIAVKSISIANRANAMTERQHRDARRDRRQARATELDDMFYRLFQSWITLKLDKNTLHELGREAGALSGRLKYTDDIAAQHLVSEMQGAHVQILTMENLWPDLIVRANWAFKVFSEWRAAMFLYLEDDSGTKRGTFNEVRLPGYPPMEDSPEYTKHD